MKAFTEFLGSFLFMGAIALVGPAGTPFAPLVVGVALVCAVYMGGHVSGAHYNPAVSLAALMQKKLTFAEFGIYVVAQLLGAAAAFCFGGWVTGAAGGIAPGMDPVTAKAFTLDKALAVEIFGTMFLTLVILNVAVHKNNASRSVYGLAIGFTIVAMAYAGGWISGGAFNPAVGFGATLSKALFDAADWSHLWIYLVGPALGGALGSVIYSLQHGTPEAPKDDAPAMPGGGGMGGMGDMGGMGM